MTGDEYYYLRKRAHICTKCGREDAFTMAGRSLCTECAERYNALQNRRRASGEAKAIRNDDRRARYARRKDEGLCVGCGKKLPQGSTMVKCPGCLAKARQAAERARRRRGQQSPHEKAALGLCSSCGKDKPMRGKRLCRKCYDTRIPNVQKAQAAVDHRNHIWREIG